MEGEVRIVDDVAHAFADLVAAEAPESIAFSGGDTARECYEVLALADVDWPRVTAWFGDERWVPVDDPDSNEGMTRAVLLDHVEPYDIRSMRNAGATAEEAAAAYGRALRAAPPIELVHLGLGTDGHTASLFPGSAALEEAHHWVVTDADDLHPHARLTVTLPMLASARLVVFTVAGEDKADAFARVCAGDALPAARVRAERVIWLVDPAAAGDARS
jgi:6-phosphogluconolactonase